MTDRSRGALTGLALPGLGHVVAWGAGRRRPGDLGIGVTLLAHVALLAWVGAAALRPGLEWPIAALDVLFSDPAGLEGGVGTALGWIGLPGPTLPYPLRDLAVHPTIAAIYAVGLAIVVWRAAWRRVVPVPVRDRALPAGVVQRFLRSRTGMLGFVGVTALVSLVVLTPFIAPHDPAAQFVGDGAVGIGWHHGGDAGQWTFFAMGTDEVGRDQFSRVLYGGRISLFIGVVTVALAATFGTAVGTIAGWYGGVVDRALMAGVDMLLALPRLVLLLAVLGILHGHGLGQSTKVALIIVVLALTGWMGVSRIVRSEVLSIKERDYVHAARALGLSGPRIMLRHLVPNALAPVIVFASLGVGTTILVEAGLSFLGLGVSEPVPTWGTLVNHGQRSFFNAPWLSTFPGLCIVWAVMSFNLIGDGLRDALDPRLRGR